MPIGQSEIDSVVTRYKQGAIGKQELAEFAKRVQAERLAKPPEPSAFARIASTVQGIGGGLYELAQPVLPSVFRAGRPEITQKEAQSETRKIMQGLIRGGRLLAGSGAQPGSPLWVKTQQEIAADPIGATIDVTTAASLVHGATRATAKVLAPVGARLRGIEAARRAAQEADEVLPFLRGELNERTTTFRPDVVPRGGEVRPLPIKDVRPIAGASVAERRAAAEETRLAAVAEKDFPFVKPQSKATALQLEAEGLSAQRERILRSSRALRGGVPTKGTQAKISPINEELDAVRQKQNELVNKNLFPFIPKRVTSPVPESNTIGSVLKAARNDKTLPTPKSVADVPISQTGKAVGTSGEIESLPLANLTEPYDPSAHSMMRNILHTTGQPPKAVIDAWGRPEALLNRTLAGKRMNQLTINASTKGRTIEARALEPIYDAYGNLKTADIDWAKKNFREYYRAGKPMPNEQLERFAQTWRSAHTMIAQEAEGVGLKFGIQQNYIPDYITEEARLAMEARNGPVWNAMRLWAERNGKDINGIVEQLFPRGDVAVRRSGSLEFAKLLGLPDKLKVGNRVVEILDSDPFSNIGKYIKLNSRRIGVVSQFGQGDETIRGVLRAAGEDQTVHNLIRRQWNDLQGIGQFPSFYTSAWGRAALGFESAGRGLQLSASVIANLTGPEQIMYKWGAKNYVRAQWDIARTWGSDKWNPIWSKDAKLRVEISRMMGGWSRRTLRQNAATEDLGAGFGLSEKVGRATEAGLRYTGLELVERNTNKAAGLAANQAVADYFNRLRTGKAGTLRRLFGSDKEAILRELKTDFGWSDDDIVRITREGMSDMDRARVFQRAPSLINNFAEGPGQRPHWMRHPLAQRALAYTSFVRIRGNMLSDAIKEIGQGNVRPIGRLLGYSVLAGESEIALKGFFKNRERVDKNFPHRLFNDLMAAATFGYLGAAYEQAKYSGADNPIDAFEEFFVPPSMDAAKAAWDVLAKTVPELAEGDIPNAAKEFETAARRLAPAVDVVSSTIRRRLAPERARRERRRRAREERFKQKERFLP